MRPQTPLNYAGALASQRQPNLIKSDGAYTPNAHNKRKREGPSLDSSPEGVSPLGKRERVASSPQNKDSPTIPPPSKDTPTSPSVHGAGSPQPPLKRRSPTKFKPGNVFDAEVNGKQWVLPDITHSRVFLGDSNLLRITKSSMNNIQVISCPGAKFYNLRGFLENGCKNKRYPAVNQVVLSVGINERENKIKTTSIPQLSRLIKQVHRIFPSATIFMAGMQWNPLGLSERQNAALTELSVVLKRLDDVTSLPLLPTEKFMIDPKDITDKIHWSTECANDMLEHWLDCLN